MKILWWYFQKTAAALISSFTTVSLSLMFAMVKALLLSVDGYKGVPEQITSTKEAISRA